MQDSYFNVHGNNFIIQRPETFAKIFPKLRPRNKLHARAGNKAPLACTPSAPPPGSCTALTRPAAAPAAEDLLPAVWGGGHPPMQHGFGDVIDVTECLEQVEWFEVDWVDDTASTSASASPPAASASTAAAAAAAVSGGLVAPVASPAGLSFPGLVQVPMGDGPDGAAMDDLEVFVGSSTSPRRTKMIGFTCLRCNARSYKPVNPQAFEEGTLVVQCGKCAVWHKINDHLGVFHDMHGELFPRPSGITEADVPESLRMPLEPFYWNEGFYKDSGDSDDTREGR